LEGYGIFFFLIISVKDAIQQPFMSLHLTPLHLGLRARDNFKMQSSIS